jgi:hypothetical protein
MRSFRALVIGARTSVMTDNSQAKDHPDTDRACQVRHRVGCVLIWQPVSHSSAVHAGTDLAGWCNGDAVGLC